MNMKAEPANHYGNLGTAVPPVPYDPAHPLPGVSTPLRIEPEGNLRTVSVLLPRGVIGSPEALPKCKDSDFLGTGKIFESSTACPSDTEVGYLTLKLYGFGERGISLPTVFGFDPYYTRVPVYNLVPPRGTPVDFGFNLGDFYHGHIYATPDPAHDYRIKATSPYTTSLMQPSVVQVTTWGVPGDPSHDRDRTCPENGSCNLSTVKSRRLQRLPWCHPDPPPLVAHPSTAVSTTAALRISVDSWNDPGDFTEPRGPRTR